MFGSRRRTLSGKTGDPRRVLGVLPDRFVRDGSSVLCTGSGFRTKGVLFESYRLGLPGKESPIGQVRK